MVIEMATFYDEIYKLKNVLRKGWQFYGVTSEHDRYESDAEHTFSMAMLALEIMGKEKLDLNQEKVLKMILVHELGEIDFGDSIHIFDYTKDADKRRKEKHDAEMNCVKRLAENYHLSSILDLWEEFEKKESKEAIFVKELDRFDSIKQAKLYSEEYNRPEIYEDFYTNNKEIADKYKKYL